MKQKYIFFWAPAFLHNSMNVSNLSSGSSVLSKLKVYIWKFSVYILLKPSLKGFAHNIASMWSEHNRTLGWAFFLIALLWDWNVNFSSPVATAELSKFADMLSVAPSQHHLRCWLLAVRWNCQGEYLWDFPGGQWLDCALPLQGVWFWSLVGELRSHIPCRLKNKNKK